MQEVRDAVPVGAVAFGAVALSVAEQLSAGGTSTTEVLAAAPLTIVTAGGSVLVARTRPVAGLALFVAGYAGQVAILGWIDSVVALALWGGLLGLAARRTDLPGALLALALGAVPVAVFAIGRDDPEAGAVGPSTLALWLVPWFAGRALRARHERHEREIALIRSEIDRRDAEGRAATAEERAAITRDVHDLLGHTVTSMVVQARSARASIGSDPPAARAALDAVEAAGQTAILELRALVAGLRSPRREARADRGLTDVADLLERVPLAVRSELDPAASHLPTPLQAAAFRVVQEALTNTIRHSQADTADLCVRLEPALLHIEVRDPGPPSTRPLPGAGTGLSSVRQDIAKLGGSLDAALDGQGFVVRALLPTRTAS